MPPLNGQPAQRIIPDMKIWVRPSKLEGSEDLGAVRWDFIIIIITTITITVKLIIIIVIVTLDKTDLTTDIIIVTRVRIGGHHHLLKPIGVH